MRLITTRDKIRDVAECWKQQYCASDGWWVVYGNPQPDVIYERLLALPDTATERDVAAIIGNDSWTRLMCDECGHNVNALVVFGEKPVGQTAFIRLCPDCLRYAVTALDGRYDKGGTQ